MRFENDYIKEFRPYIGGIIGDPLFEIVPWVVFDTIDIHNNTTTRIDFFANLDNSKVHGVDTNMFHAGMLPNPQAFLIESIRIFGVNSAIAHAGVRLDIGNKVYMVTPLLSHSIKGNGYRMIPAIMIPPQVHFRVSISWRLPVQLGKNFTGEQMYKQSLQVAMYGKLARPVC